MAQEEVTNGGAAVAAEKTVTFTAFRPQLTVEAPKAADAVAFYKTAFGAVEISRSQYPKRKADQELPQIISAELQIAGSTIVVSDSNSNSVEKKTDGEGGLLTFYLETEDVEAAVIGALAAGAVKDEEVAKDGESGGRVQTKVKDPYGLTWIISSPAPKKTATETEA